jgi:uncharacterized OsmC-like protein
MIASTSLNGVDRQKLFGTIEAVKANPLMASFQFRLLNQWMGGGESRSSIDDYCRAGEEMRHEKRFLLVSDAPQTLLSDDVAPHPVEFLLHALAGCMTTALAYHAAARDIELRSVTTRFEGDLDLRGFLGVSNDVRRGLDAIRVIFTIDANCSPAMKHELIKIAQARSPVFDMISNGLPVVCTLDRPKAAKAA